MSTEAANLAHSSPTNLLNPSNPSNDSAVSVNALSSSQEPPNPLTETKPESPNIPLFPPEPTPEQKEAQAIENSAAVQQAQDQIFVDSASEYSESDAGYGTSIQTATTSLSSSLRDYEFEHGRRYHKFRSGQYNFPNDDSEQDREDLKHAVSFGTT
jgi:hypothetical protein